MQVLLCMIDYFCNVITFPIQLFSTKIKLKVTLKHAYKCLYIYNELLVDNIVIYSRIGMN